MYFINSTLVYLFLLLFPTLSTSFVQPICTHIITSAQHNHHYNDATIVNHKKMSSCFIKLASTLDDENNAYIENDENDENDNDEDKMMFELNIEDVADQQKDIMDELAWRSMKVNLEEANTRSFQKKIKSRPWKLPYDEAKKWVQANLGPETKEEFYDLVVNGNLRTPYIPKDPEKYYSESGTWISWNHFLKE